MTAPPGRGLIVSAPSSGVGKTTVTLGLLRALARRGIPVRGAKSGPDYIDPRFHEAATGLPCPNLDAWAMAPGRVRGLAAGPGLLVVEGAMGLFDGAPPDGRGATADLARILGLPVVLVVDAARTAQSVAPLVAGFARHDARVEVAGVILNRVGSARHERMLRGALAGGPAAPGLRVLGALPRLDGLAHPSRHLGLVQAAERPDLDAFLDAAADAVEAAVDLDALAALARPLPATRLAGARPPPPAQRIAVARDEAFAFTYPHVLAEWRAAGASRHALLAARRRGARRRCRSGDPPRRLPRAARRTPRRRPHLPPPAWSGRPALADIHGECGGYMALGEALIDAHGDRHAMLGLLPLVTSFAERRLHLGYRSATFLDGPFQGDHAAHEFHYATTLREEGPSTIIARDAEGAELGGVGLSVGRVRGSFLHLIERSP